MAQGAEFDLVDIRYYTNTSDVYFVTDNEPIEDLNTNILTVDDKAIFARDIAQQAATDFAAHQGGGGAGVHGPATPSVAGFMSAADKNKLDGIQAGASVNIISPTDALELVGKGETKLHKHPIVTSTRQGFMSAAQITKLSGIETGADVNNVSDVDAATLTNGPASNATLLHTHFQPSFTETFTEAAHFTHDHTGLPGITVYSGLNGVPWVNSVPIFTTGAYTVEIYSETFGFDISSLSGGIGHIKTSSYWANKLHRIEDIQIVGNEGLITHSIQEIVPISGGVYQGVWMGAAGL